MLIYNLLHNPCTGGWQSEREIYRHLIRPDAPPGYIRCTADLRDACDAGADHQPAEAERQASQHAPLPLLARHHIRGLKTGTYACTCTRLPCTSFSVSVSDMQPALACFRLPYCRHVDQLFVVNLPLFVSILACFGQGFPREANCVS